MVSVGLPVYNGERYLAQAVESILTQDIDLELLIADNASTDATGEIARDIAASDARVRYLGSNENRGATWNYNRLVPLARGRYFKWAAHDDLCGPGFLRSCTDVLDDEPSAALAYPRTVLIDEFGAVTDRGFVDGLAIDDPSPVGRFARYIDHSGEQHAVFGVIRQSILARTSLIANCWGGDVVLLAQLVLLGPFLEIPDRLFLRRYHGGSSLVANRSPAEVAQWFDPTRRGRTALPRTRLLRELACVVARADLGPADRARCLAILATRWSMRYGRVMGGEVKLFARSITSGV